MKSLPFAAVAAFAIASSAHAEIGATEAARLASAARVVEQIHQTIPQEYWDRGRCVVVIPELKKAAFIFGGEYGKGVLSCRNGNEWSAPVFMQLAKGSWGFQVGAEQVDVVMLVMNESGVQKLLKNKVTLGADASVAAGPIGRQGQVGTDAMLSAEIISYSRAQGLFAGVDLSGGVLRPDEDANRAAYGPDVDPKTILSSRSIVAPPQASAFLRALEVGPGDAPGARSSAVSLAADRSSNSDDRSSGTDRSSTANDRSSRADRSSAAADTPATTASDVRTQLVDMQQTLDRLLADDNRPVGTSGSASGDMVTVDRAQLERLRRQLDAALEAVDRRR
jgi:lipid-binding SYLF domain-containing protein